MAGVCVSSYKDQCHCANVWQDWRNIELIHIFQEQLITGSRFLTTERRSQSNLEGLVNLQNATTFDEHFFLVVVERTKASSSTSGSCTVHMWCMVISSQGIWSSSLSLAEQQPLYIADFCSPLGVAGVSSLDSWWKIRIWVCYKQTNTCILSVNYYWSNQRVRSCNDWVSMW